MAAFPILFLYARNVANVPMSVVLWPLLLSLLGTLLLWLLLGAVLHDRRKAGLLVALVLVLFFSYGHFNKALEPLAFTIGRVSIGPDKVLCPVWLLLLVGGGYLVLRVRADLRRLTAGLNFVALGLVGLSALQIAIFAVRTWRAEGRASRAADSPGPAAAEAHPASLPNIYYIILDGYARSDTLKAVYGYDNGEFLARLTAKGFYVAQQARSNYPQTCLSLASSLNFEHLDALASRIGADFPGREPLNERILHSKAAKFLKRQGYTFVALSSGYSNTEIKNADVYWSPSRFGSLNEFHNALVASTALRAVADAWKGVTDRGRTVSQYMHARHRERSLFQLRKLVETCDLKPPVFVFAHVLACHTPFVFGPNGDPIEPPWPFDFLDGVEWLAQPGATREAYIRGYTDQLRFMSREVAETVEAILANSQRPPIILLQGDHGPGLNLHEDDPARTDVRERFRILNAYHLPGGGSQLLYEGITPVNTFRVIFNQYFGTHLELQKDASYFSTWLLPYKFLDVTDRAKGPWE